MAADDPYYIQSIQIQGFRAYLQPKEFDLSKKRCMAVFAPNGNGKSSLIDALEFMFSKDGTLRRLGERTVNNQAGVYALAHNLSTDRGIQSRVSLNFIRGADKSEGSRDAGAAKPLQQAATASVSSLFVVPPIIRGYELRSFVEVQSAQDRYNDFAGWVQLKPLVDVQNSLRSLRQQIGSAADDNAEAVRIGGQLARETGNVLLAWDESQVLDHINVSVLSPLDAELNLVAIKQADPALAILNTRVKDEEGRIGLTGLRQNRLAMTTLYDLIQVPDADVGDRVAVGAMSVFEASIQKLAQAIETEIAERAKSEKAAFAQLWAVAQPFFAAGSNKLEVCPVCETPLDHTPYGTAEEIFMHIAAHVGELVDYDKAKRVLDGSIRETDQARAHLLAALSSLLRLEPAGHEELLAAGTTYQIAVRAWTEGAFPESKVLALQLLAHASLLKNLISELERNQGEHTYAKAKYKIERLLNLGAEQSLAIRVKEEMQALTQALSTQMTFIRLEIRQKVQSLLDIIEAPANEIYRQIQAERAVPIRLELPAESDSIQQRLNVVIDFAANREGVQPSGFLSDSQIHSVALSIRLAAIKCFNTGAPILALDDVVTSYDADHRRTIAGVLASEFGGWQVIVTTHDERFFNYMKDQFSPKNWQFMRILTLDPKFGPRFADHRVTDEMIQARWDEGGFATNEMRQAEEEWLLTVCRDFGVSLRIRPLEKPYAYERSELASALASFLNKANLIPQPVDGVDNAFLTSLSKGEIENFGSHFQDGPYGDGSKGDEIARWKEFKFFQSQFACLQCHRKKFKRPNTLKKPVCAHESCEAQFAFVAPVAPTKLVTK